MNLYLVFFWPASGDDLRWPRLHGRANLLKSGLLSVSFWSPYGPQEVKIEDTGSTDVHETVQARCGSDAAGRTYREFCVGKPGVG